MQTESQIPEVGTVSVVTTPAKATFMSIKDLKAKLGIDTIDIVKNPTTGKLFAVTPEHNFKVQLDIDFTKPMSFRYDDDNFYDGCICNITVNTVAVI